jgi:kojibiose phosphorylase
MNSSWVVSKDRFDQREMHHSETIFTIGSGYFCTRGVFEEGFDGDQRTTFIHGVFDDAPLVFTQLANAPDWLPLTVYLDGERFSMASGTIEEFRQTLDLECGLLTRSLRWRSPGGRSARLIFERFASLADPRLAVQRIQVLPEFSGSVEIRAAIHGGAHNEGLVHWDPLQQGRRGEVVFLTSRTRTTQIELAMAMNLRSAGRNNPVIEFWDAYNAPTQVLRFDAHPGEWISVEKYIAIAASRDVTDPLDTAVDHVCRSLTWQDALDANRQAWEAEWQRCDVVIEGDDEAQLAVRFSLYHLLIAAPRGVDRVNIGAKTLSGFGYHGHAFWDTETFMLPLFTYTHPEIARSLLDYRYYNLPGAREKALANGFEGAQFPWESAGDGREVTPTWVPHFSDRTRLVRIWTGDIEIHISADIALAVMQYWQATGDDAWMIAHGVEIVLDTARFWASRAEWNVEQGRFEYNDVIGPDEYHDHVDNNFFTNYVARWNLAAALKMFEWIKATAPDSAADLSTRLDLSKSRLDRWQHIIDHIYLPGREDGLIEQFEGYFKRTDVDLATLEPRSESVQALLGIEGANQTQVLKQPDVLMLLTLFCSEFSDRILRINYDYYNARTDHSFGSSLGPSIHAIVACELGELDQAYEHFIRAARADLRDVRDNAGDGIHGASAGGVWQAIVFGFGGLKFSEQGPVTRSRLPSHWKRLAFRVCYRGKVYEVDLS